MKKFPSMALAAFIAVVPARLLDAKFFLLASSKENCDALLPQGELTTLPPKGENVSENAMSDPRNPIRKLFRGERLDLWSLKAPDWKSFDKNASIDSLVRRRCKKAGIEPSPEADRRTLIRRLSFDLIGLPPTMKEVERFIGEDSPDAYENLVDRLLASPRYGERQARLWLDVVRYADTQGYERDEFRPLMWKYRDYVVKSFNRDKPFDHFVREQLAGDELVAGPPKNEEEADALIATGYLRLGQWDSTASIFQEDDRLRAEQMADLTNTTASAFLGLTMSCCQCHDHKYDPLSQADHYRLRAFFSGVEAEDELVVELPEKLAEIRRRNETLDKRMEALKKKESELKEEKDEEGLARIEKEKENLEKKRVKPSFATGASDSGSSTPVTRVFYQGDFRAPREEVFPGFVSVLHPGPAKVTQPRDDTSGRRLALADWIASPENPWTARVIVNRIWQQHFDRGLVETPNDFGLAGAKPTHPDLLDWLALQFVRDGWSIKELHRKIVTSATYRQSSSIPPRKGGSPSPHAHPDPENTLLWRQNLRRLDAETLRDSLLAVSGLLKTKNAGKPLWPEVQEDLLKAQPSILEALEGKDGGRMQGWYPDPKNPADVRSLYLVRKRSLPIPFLQAFDLPGTTVSCGRRDTTIVAPQALMLLNSPSAVRYAKAFSKRVAGLTDDAGFNDAANAVKTVKTVFRLGLQRDPAPDESRLARDLLARHMLKRREKRDEPEARRLALADLCRAVLNLNEFIYID